MNRLCYLQRNMSGINDPNLNLHVKFNVTIGDVAKHVESGSTVVDEHPADHFKKVEHFNEIEQRELFLFWFV